jgi:hypothetical protein
MLTRDYITDVYPMIEALCGVQFSNIEKPRIVAMFNRRAKRAFRATHYWTRFIVIGEERLVVNNTVPFSEVGKSSIDTYLRVHRHQPYIQNAAQDYDYMVTSNGAVLVSGNSNPTSVFVTYKRQFTDRYGDGNNGSVSDIPDEWADYLAYGTYADYLRGEGQQEKASFADQEADIILQDELMRLDEQRTQNVISTRFMTNLNMQPR